MASAEKAASYEDMIAQAEAAVAALRDSYREQLVADSAALIDIWASLEQGATPTDVLHEIHAVAHNVKGQGGSFGYDLVTSIGASLCDYIRSGDRTSADGLNIVHAHIKILKMVGDNDISGTGGETGERIVAKLHALTH
ncbi:MAG TPA: Hpt domain-containing protein [Parvibaculum sp.]|jgi:chemotaxis protein histidine kinase CheA